ncbi:MAG: hypothetical protein KF857_00670 [Fimbriimonadaceae bacterium]|nr:hypothetical protein [Fimbriimonadaceae bacterium]
MQTQFSDENSFDQQLGEDVERFLARFASWMDVDPAPGAKKAKAAVESLGRLEQELPGLTSRVRDAGDKIDRRLAATFFSAAGQVESLLDEWRVRLGVVAPGAPRSSVDLDALQSRLQEREARQELGVSSVPAYINVKTGSGSWAAAAGTGVFALGWNAFTLFHATIMIGGMWRAFGPAALALLLFYAIFFAAGFAMIAATVAALSDEEIDLDGRDLTVTTTTLGRKKVKSFVLADGAQAEVTTPTLGNLTFRNRGDSQAKSTSVVVRTVDGKLAAFGSRLTPQEKQALARRINAYLAAQPSALA